MKRDGLWRTAARRGTLSGCAALALWVAAPAAAQQILPPGFFDAIPAPAGERMAVEADLMVFDSVGDTVRAEGAVGLNHAGYRARADRAIYHQRSGRVELVGNVALIDPEGIEYTAERVDLTGGFRQGFLEALTVAFPDGSRFTAAQTGFDEGLERVYLEGRYAPCGSCVDDQGRQIGWQVRAARIVTDEAERTLYFEDPQLELLGVPIVSLPFLFIPQDEDLDFPVFSYDEKYGFSASFPFFRFQPFGGRLLLTPTLFTRQGLMAGADWRQTVGDLDYRVAGSAIYQLDPGAYQGTGDREFRGAIQTSGAFRASAEWTLGWSYTAFTDPGYLPDYRIADGHATNEVFATRLSRDGYADIRVQEFLPLDTYASDAVYDRVRREQGRTLPSARIEEVIELEDEAGRVTLSGRLLGLSRLEDHRSGAFTHGYEGSKGHAAAQARWTRQWIAGGVAFSPTLGLRADAAAHDGTSTAPGAPGAETLFSTTPIAALDARYPLLVSAGGAAHVVEPVAQIVYRGSGTSRVGITNDDAQSVVLDDINLFSLDRFSGWDRQETGLRANLGVNLGSSFTGGGWINAVIGQSFHLAGTNAFSVTDGSTATLGSGLEHDASAIVAGLEGGFSPLLAFGGKLQYDPNRNGVARGMLHAEGAAGDVGYGLDYVHVAAEPALSSRDRHEIGVRGSLTLADYWTARAGVAWDLAQNQWLQATAGLHYDDRFLAYGLDARWTGATHRDPNEFRIMASFRLRAAGSREIFGLRHGWVGE